MYTIIGVDQKEYGPIPADLLLQWITQGRANAQTMARAEGTTDWKLLGQFPELAAALAAKAPPPPMTATGAPLGTGLEADRLAAEIIARDYSIDISRLVGDAWTLLKNNFWLLVGLHFVMLLIVGLVPIVGTLLAGPCFGGLFHVIFKLRRGERAEFGDGFAVFNTLFLPLFLCGIVTQVLTGLGFLLCILPGIYLAVAWILSQAIIVDKRYDFWPAMELSRKVVSAHWWQFFALLIVSGLLNVLGALACGVGMLITVPLGFTMIAGAYDEIFNGNQPKTA